MGIVCLKGRREALENDLIHSEEDSLKICLNRSQIMPKITLTKTIFEDTFHFRIR